MSEPIERIMAALEHAPGEFVEGLQIIQNHTSKDYLRGLECAIRAAVECPDPIALYSVRLKIHRPDDDPI